VCRGTSRPRYGEGEFTYDNDGDLAKYPEANPEIGGAPVDPQHTTLLYASMCELSKEASNPNAFLSRGVLHRRTEEQEAKPSGGVEGSPVLIGNFAQGIWDEASLVEKDCTSEEDLEIDEMTAEEALELQLILKWQRGLRMKH
jgi:hypothetical protein